MMQSENPLGREVAYVSSYKPELLFPVPRETGRELLGITGELPFAGCDFWNCYELSWLEPGGKPRVAIAEIIFALDSTNIVESKSLKLYLNSFNQTRFTGPKEVREVMQKDLEKVVQGQVKVTLKLPEMFQSCIIEEPGGLCLDNLAIETDCYTCNPDFLISGGAHVHERLHSNLLRSNCPVTGQPDWATVIVEYSGKAIDHAGLLRYIVSFREHTGFHENCVEQIFVDLTNRCKPDTLMVYARFTRRGGLDINPFRASSKAFDFPGNSRTARQ